MSRIKYQLTVLILVLSNYENIEVNKKNRFESLTTMKESHVSIHKR